jgi:uncharacterized protein YkwD
MLAAILPACAGPLAAEPALAGAARSSSTCPGAHLRPSAANAPAVDAATLCLIDRVRAANRLRALAPNGELGAVAAGQLGSMMRWNYFADVRPTGQTPMKLVSATRYPAHAAGFSVGQNIAWGAGPSATPARIVASWMASPAHRRLILRGEFRDAGVAMSPTVPSALGAWGQGAIYAIEFGARRF